MSGESFEDILLRGLTDDYEFVKMTSFHSPNFGINDIQLMMINLYIDRLSRPSDVNKIAGKGVAMATTRKPRKVRCYNCQEFGRIKRDWMASKKERPTTSKWCSLHNSTTHGDAECKAQKGKEDTNTPPQGKVHSAHVTTVSTPTEEEDFVCLRDVITSCTVGSGCPAQASACFTHRHTDEDTAIPTVSAGRRLGVASPTIYGSCTDVEN